MLRRPSMQCSQTSGGGPRARAPPTCRRARALLLQHGLLAPPHARSSHCKLAAPRQKMERLLNELDHGPQGIVALLALWQECIYRQQAWA